MVYEEAHNPCDSKLEENDQCCQFFALYFPVGSPAGGGAHGYKEAQKYSSVHRHLPP